MKLYRLTKTSVTDGHQGFEFYASKREAAKARREWFGNFKIEERVCDLENSDYEEIKIEPTRAGILRALNLYASHPDNG